MEAAKSVETTVISMKSIFKALKAFSFIPWRSTLMNVTWKITTSMYLSKTSRFVSTPLTTGDLQTDLNVKETN